MKLKVLMTVTLSLLPLLIQPIYAEDLDDNNNQTMQVPADTQPSNSENSDDTLNENSSAQSNNPGLDEQGTPDTATGDDDY